MKTSQLRKMLKPYAPLEERLNVQSHFAGIVLSVVAFVLLMMKAYQYQSWEVTISFFIFGCTMLVLYVASTIYHSSINPRKRYRYKIFDHIAIFLFIAGTYTPYAMVTLKDNGGDFILGIVWGIALVGTVLKVFFTGRFKIISTLLYVGMGWIIVFSFQNLADNLGENGIFWLLAGGAAYTIGALCYSIKKLHFNHALFHVFVLLGSLCHFISIYLYVQPRISI